MSEEEQKVLQDVVKLHASLHGLKDTQLHPEAVRLMLEQLEGFYHLLKEYNAR